MVNTVQRGRGISVIQTPSANVTTDLLNLMLKSNPVWITAEQVIHGNGCLNALEKDWSPLYIVFC